MSKVYFLSFLITISFLFLKADCKLGIIESSIIITSEMQSNIITHEDNLHLFSSTFDKSLGKFIYLLLEPKDYENEYNHIFVSIPGEEGKIPTYKESDYKTVDKNTTLLIETKNIGQNITTAKITIECKEYCDFTLYYQIITIIPFISDRSFDLILNSNEEFILEYNPELTNDFNNKFTFFSNAPSDFELKIIYNDAETISPLTEFYNGYGLFINNEKFPDGGKFTFKLNHYGKPNELVHVSNRKLTEEIRNLAVGDFHNSITGIPNLDEECFNLPKISEEEPDKKYNLNFLTYTKNILIIFDDSDKFLIDTESDLIQIDAKKYSKMCFSSNNGKIATTTFQILDGTDQTSTQDMQMPLYRGMPKKAKLLKGEIAYYRLYFYPPFSENLVMNLKSIEGKAELYYGVCRNYPNCNFQVDQLKELETEKNINNNIFMKKPINENMEKPYSDPEFQVAVVYCTNEENEKDCEYFITLSNDNDEINIIENERYYSNVKGYEINKYQFDIYDYENQLEYLFINLYSYTGQGTITLYSDKEMTQEITEASFTSIQNQEIALITASNLSSKTLNGHYFIKIRGLTNTIYSIYYYTKNKNSKLTENYLLSNEVNIQSLKLNSQEISFFVKNNAAHKNIPFLFEYNSLNCDLEVSLNGEIGSINERNYQYIIDSSKSYYNDDYYEMKIKAKNADIEGMTSDSLCLVAITSGVIEDKKEIVLSDGVIQKGKLSKNVKYINYLYTFIINSFEDQVSLFFKKDSNYIIDLGYGFGNSDPIKYQVVKNEKRIVFNKNDIDDKCKHYNESCSLNIQIKLNEKETLTENSYIDFTLIVNNKVTYPSYLPKDKLIKNILQTNQYQYYYLDIGKNEECDIVLDFDEGFGQAIAKIVKKDEIEENSNYNRRVLLPLPGMAKNFIFDQYTKELKITKEMTSKCEKGCEIYIAVFHVDQRFTDYISSFNIYYRKNNNIVYVPENTIVSGNLKSFEGKNIYRTKINKNIGISIFNVKGEHIFVYINKGEEIPSSEKKDYIIDSEKQNQLVINYDSSQEQIFTYVVQTDKLENKYYRTYDLKIDIPESSSLDIKMIDYLHNNPCYFNKNNIKCNYILPVEKYNKENKIYLFTPDNKNTLIYANFISMEEFDSLTEEEKKEKLPKKSADSEYYLMIDISDRTNEIYVLITVETTDTQNESTANLVVGGFYFSSTSFFRPNSYSFFSLTNDTIRNELNLAFESDDLYEVNFVYISGERGNISQSQINKVFYFDLDTNEVLTFLFESDLKVQKLFTIKYNPIHKNDELCFYTYLQPKSNLSNLVYIKYPDNQEQKFEFLKNEKNKNFFPLAFYELIEKNEKEDKQFIFQINDTSPAKSLLFSKKLIVEGYILNKTTIENIKINPKILENETIVSNGEFCNNIITPKITFTKEIIKNNSIYYENYFYINIKNSNDEEIEFDYVEINLFKSLFNLIDINKYSIHQIKGKENKNLLLVPDQRIGKMAIDLFVEGKANIGKYDFTINEYFYENDDYSKNETYIIDDAYTERRDEVKYSMVFINLNMHYIVLNVIKTDYNNANNESYIIKYRIEDTYPTYYYLDKNRSIKFEVNGYNLNMNFNGIRECEKSCTFHDDFAVNYAIRFYEKKNINPNEIRNIILNEKVLYEFNLTKVGEAQTKEDVNWKVKIEKLDEKAQLAQIVGYASFGDNEELFVYKSFSFKYGEKIIKDRKFEFWLILFSFIGIIIITFGVMYVYIYAQLEIGRRTLMLNNANNISLITRPSDRTSGNTNTRMTV